MSKKFLKAILIGTLITSICATPALADPSLVQEDPPYIPAAKMISVPATCTEDAVEVFYLDDVEQSRQTFEGTALGHDWGAWTEVARKSYLSADGERGDSSEWERECNRCHETEHRHTIKIPATCGKDGYETDLDGNRITIQKTERHDWGAWVPAGDSDKLTRTCRVCGEKESKQNAAATVSEKKEPATVQKAEPATESAGKTVSSASGGTSAATKKVATKKIKATVKGKTKITLKKGKTAKIKVKRTPARGTGKITYKSSNKKVATVSKTGKIKAKKKGKATITVKCGKLTKKIKVAVK